jgi:hypothetical protein
MREVDAMLDSCAHGWFERPLDHNRGIYYRGRFFPLPKGAHGKRRGAGEVFTGHIRHMVSQLGIQRSCVERFFPLLWGEKGSRA